MDTRTKEKAVTNRAFQALEALVLAADNSNNAHTIAVHSIACGESQLHAKIRNDNIRAAQYHIADIESLIKEDFLVNCLIAHENKHLSSMALV